MLWYIQGIFDKWFLVGPSLGVVWGRTRLRPIKFLSEALTNVNSVWEVDSVRRQNLNIKSRCLGDEMFLGQRSCFRRRAEVY